MQRPDRSYVPNREYPGQGAPVRQLMWDDESHFKFLTTMYGSVWPQVFPFCVANAAICLAVYELKLHNIADLTFSPSGHRYMGMLMSFLVIMRVKISYDHYAEANKLLSACYRACRELVQFACLLTSCDKSNKARQWRQDVAYSTILMLRVTMAVLEMPSNPNVDPWDVPELSQEHQHYIKHVSLWHTLQHADSNRGPSTTGADPETSSERSLPSSLAHSDFHDRYRLEEAFRAPAVLAYALRREILKQRDGNWLRKGILIHPCNEEVRMLDMVGDFLKAFEGLKKLMTTKFPFPLVQMAKTFMFVWVFTLSSALNNEPWKQPYFVMAIVTLTTFGFLGLELVAMELSDMFGEDPCDFDNLGYAQLCFEDMYISIYKQDGEQWARSLREKVLGRLVTSDALGRFRESTSSRNLQQQGMDASERSQFFGTPTNSVTDLNALPGNMQDDLNYQQRTKPFKGWFF